VGRRVTAPLLPNIPLTKGIKTVAVIVVTIIDATLISKRTVKIVSNLNLIRNSVTKTTKVDLISLKT
jgi:hypothetical protein